MPSDHQQNNAARRHVVIVGSANQDLTAYTPTVPTLGQTVMGTSFTTCPGGRGANQAVAAASLGIAPVTIVCRVGSDSFGSALLQNFRQVGVRYDKDRTVVPPSNDRLDEDGVALADDDMVERGLSHTGVATIAVDTATGENTSIVIPGANHALLPSDVRSTISKLEGASTPAVVAVQLEIKPESAREALKVGRACGALTILNPAPSPTEWMMDDAWFINIDILILNETELRVLCRTYPCPEDSDEEAMAKVLLGQGVRRAVIVTLGARGAMIVSRVQDGADGNTEITFVSAPPNLPCNGQPVVDTVGAGDAFCGALSAYLSFGIDLAVAATKACGVASMSVRKRGAQSSYPSADEIPDILKVDVALEPTRKTTIAPAASVAKPAITFVTGSKNKLLEVQQILSSHGDFPFSITNEKIDLPELQGLALDIAVKKCRYAAEKIDGPVITEDTFLCFNALRGMPGQYIKWLLDKCGHERLNDTLAGFDDKSAYAHNVVAFCCGPGQDVNLFDGRTRGKIVRPRGSLDFGWDPIFEPEEGGGKTYAEMTKDEKNAISHRGRSFAKLRRYLIMDAGDIKEKIGGQSGSQKQSIGPSKEE